MNSFHSLFDNFLTPLEKYHRHKKIVANFILTLTKQMQLSLLQDASDYLIILPTEFNIYMTWNVDENCIQ